MPDLDASAAIVNLEERRAAPRIGIVVVAYNAVSTLAQVLDRIPVAFRSRISDVLVYDDASQDSTSLFAYQLLYHFELSFTATATATHSANHVAA